MAYVDFFRGARAAESSGNPNAVNRITGAAGLYQFMPDTWAGVVRNYGERYGIRADGVMDPAQQELAIRAITENEYAPVIRRLGRTVTPEELYAFHLFGGPTYTGLATADPSAPAAEALRNNRISWRSIFDANRGVFGDSPDLTAGEAIQRVQAYYARKANPQTAGRPRQSPPPVSKVVPATAPGPSSMVASTPKPTAPGFWTSLATKMTSMIRALKNPN
ncbi:LT_GEWL domain containing protein [uncultured Caudovirales phage]|uniref:LT_GEWL domain containing protein n=1 Tax=uncultured Caudovirales phage TaxID=2100421 RepID=A0A6J5P1Q5_9CAUD|nr:LT_GEWL domain containing protein [uncultured Caudovirales phage]